MLNKRKKWIINKPFQYHFILITLIPLLLLLCFFWLGLELIFYEMVSYAKELDLPKNHSFYIFLKEQKTRSLVILFLTVLPSIIIYFCWGVFYSNKIAGPLYRLDKYFQQLKENNTSEIPKLSFRNKDYFTELTDSINNYLQKK